MSMGELIEKFRTVGLERIEQMNSLLVALEREPDDAERVEEILREIHTLKGEAKMMGFADVNLVAHQTENLLLAVISDGVVTNQEPVDLVFEGLDLMRGLLTKTAGDSGPLDLTGFVDRVAEFRHQDDSSAPAQSESPPQQDKPAKEDTSKEPAPADSPADKAPADKAPADKPEESPGATRTRIDTTAQSSEREATNHRALRIQTSTSLRVDVEKLERIGDIAGETLLMSRRLSFHLGQLRQIRGDLRELQAKIDGHLPKSRAMALRDLTHRLDACETELREENYLVNLRASQVDDQARRLRHIPLAQVLSHYPRAVRDLAGAQGKNVRLTHTFGNVEVDRTILTALSEPLLHLVRNAVDHGIEDPQARRNAGKDPEGEVRLIAEYSGDSIRVELSDDGRGIDPEALRQKAIERDFLSPEKARRLTDQEAMALIFESGFSTREAVSDVSGRGIGMNVVRRQVARIGGFIEIESEVGQGTTFTLHLPIASAINAVLVFLIADRHFSLTAKDVERVALVDRDQLSRVHGGLCLRMEEGLVPLVDWSGLLGIGDRGQPPQQLTVLLIRKGARRVALWIDDVIGEREAISRSLGDFLSGIDLCRGVALTDSGAVVPLLNAVALMDRSSSGANLDIEETHQRRSFATVQGIQAPKIRTVLVVEDSEVTRSLVVSILKNQNYRVLEADDGFHGWTMLQRHKVNLVLTDVQMPRMSGLELLAKIRDHDDYADLPVIILSTLGESKDKKKAMGLGANGYLVKLSFEEKDLIQAVERYIG